MPAIGRRALLLGAVVAPFLRADAHQDIVDVFASMTAALSEDVPNAAGFLRPFDKAMPGFGDFERNVKALVMDWIPASSIEFLSDEGDDAKRRVDLDWFLELHSRQEGGPVKNRRETVHCELVKQGRRWRIVSMEPRTLFKP